MVLIGREAELLGPDVDVAGKDVVGDDILDEGRLVVALFKAGLGTVQCDLRHHAQSAGDLVLSVREHGIVEIRTEGGHGDHGFSGKMDGAILGKRHDSCQLRKLRADQRLVAAGDDGPVCIKNADLTVGGCFHLLDDVGKNMIHHAFVLQCSIFNSD